MKFTPNPLLYGANKDFFSAFRLAIRMKETVDYGLLCRSAEKAIERYPYMQWEVTRGFQISQLRALFDLIYLIWFIF